MGRRSAYMKWMKRSLKLIKQSKKKRGRKSKCNQDQKNDHMMQWEPYDDMSIDIGEEILTIPEDNNTTPQLPVEGPEGCWPELDQLQEAINAIHTEVYLSHV